MASDRGRKEQSPPPLLLMPAGEGLTMSASSVPSLLMPLTQSEIPLIPSDEEAEADSFLGQSPVKPTGSGHFSTGSGQFSMFSQLPETNDPFSQVSQPNAAAASRSQPSADPFMFRTTPQKATPPRNTSTPPLMGRNTSTPPLMATPGTVSSPMMGAPANTNAPVASVPPTMAPPKGQTQNFHRLQGPLRYAQPPPGTYANTAMSTSDTSAPPISISSGPPISQSITQVPNSASFPITQTTHPQPAPPPTSSSSPSDPTPPPSNMNPSSMGVYPSGVGMPGPSVVYQPVQHHWFYCKRVELKLLWIPFSHTDSSRLEEAFITAIQDGGNTIVCTNGDRYDVDMDQRTRQAVYWEEETSQVRRCSWFYKQEGDNRLLPYEEEFADRLEEEYRNAITNNMWHKRLEFPGGETIVMHSPQVIVHFRPSSQPDEWGTTQTDQYIGDQLRPRVVRRGIDDFDSIEEGEGSHVDHLVFVVHGIGPICDLRFRNIVECVNDFRSVSLSLMKSHFRSYMDEGRVGRVEFLPVHWHSALHGDATGIDRRLKAITLNSIAKLRHFTNDTLLDILFYASPTYSQQIIDTITSEMNRMYDLFLSRNQTFNGEVSVAGHSLGSLILFDLLLNQGNQMAAPEPDKSQTPVQTMAQPAAVAPPLDDSLCAEETEEDLVLEVLLEKLGISNLLPKFQQEQIDMDTLTLCDENDIKEMGIPMGPRKKLLSFMKERKEKQAKQQEAKIRAIETAAMQKLDSTSAATENHTDSSSGYPLLRTGSNTFVNYVVGTTGIGVPSIKYPQLTFEPSNFFAIGSPISMFLTVRGVEHLGEELKFPTCPGFFNIFHPFDPVAYRMEPLISAMYSSKPVLIPHHKGRKRLHLELRDSLSRVGESLKQKILDSVRTTWSTINDFARAHRTTPEDVVNEQVDSVLTEMSKEEDDHLETGSTTSSVPDDGQFGSLNQGRRIDYVLQEKPIESFNDYLFALGSHMCYWESEDTVLLILKETYALSGIVPEKPGQLDRRRPLMAPPQGFPPSPTSPVRSPHHHPPPHSHSPINTHSSHMTPPPGSIAPPPASISPPPGPLAPPSYMGPPPMQGFVRTK